MLLDICISSIYNDLVSPAEVCRIGYKQVAKISIIYYRTFCDKMQEKILRVKIFL